jgi:hypothetical protein
MILKGSIAMKKPINGTFIARPSHKFPEEKLPAMRMKNSIVRLARNLSVVTTLLALLGVATSVQAASFRKSWDPIFNTDLSATLGWRGEALIFVDDACIGSGVDVMFPNDCGPASVQSYVLELYDVGTNALVDMGSGAAPGLPAVEVVSFDGSAIPDGISLAGPLLFQDLFRIALDEAPVWAAELTFGLTGPSLRLTNVECQDEICSYVNDGQNYPPTVEWSLVTPPSQVPTPATLALFGIGLAGLGWSRRKKL